MLHAEPASCAEVAGDLRKTHSLTSVPANTIKRFASGLSAIHFLATHPERVSALVLVNSYAHYVRDVDYM